MSVPEVSAAPVAHTPARAGPPSLWSRAGAWLRGDRYMVDAYGPQWQTPPAPVSEPSHPVAIPTGSDVK
ncbi:MAG: hypothetical protein WBQ18_14090 [Solirubrobacteraceae bacterium]